MICKKCQDPFPNRIKIDGKFKNLQRRKYCFKCSPYKTHNTKPLHLRRYDDMEDKNKICPICEKKHKYRTFVCVSCLSNYRRFMLKEQAIEYKGGKCIDCGYNKCPRSLVFHHLDETEKDFAISNSHTKNWEQIKLELDKCVLLCSNCHNDRHWQEGNEKRKIQKEKIKKYINAAKSWK